MKKYVLVLSLILAGVVSNVHADYRDGKGRSQKLAPTEWSDGYKWDADAPPVSCPTGSVASGPNGRTCTEIKEQFDITINAPGYKWGRCPNHLCPQQP